MPSLAAYATVLGLGFGYFVGAIPAGVALGVPVAAAAVIAWVGYTAGAGAVVLLGEPLRRRLAARFGIAHREGEKKRLIHRAWDRFGLPALALLAPVTIGPQLGGILGLALGVRPQALVLALSLGLLPWAALFSLLVALGFRIAGAE